MSSITKTSFPSIEASSSDGKNRVRVNFLRSRLPSNWFLLLLAIPMIAALGISSYLTYVSATAGEVAGCSGGQLFDCSHVIYSKWSKFIGVPVSGLAVLTYIGMITGLAVVSFSKLSEGVRQLAWTAVTGLAIAAALAGIYFIVLQAFVLEHYCPWCLGAHACGILIAVSILKSSFRIDLPRLAPVGGLAAAGLAVMIGVQVNSKEVPKYSEMTMPPKLAVAPQDKLGQPNETYVSSPTDDGLMSPPEDEDFMSPPVDDEDFMEPPSEDLDDEDEDVLDYDPETEGETVQAMIDQINQIAMINPAAMVTGVLHAPAKQESAAKKEQSDSKQKKSQKPKQKKRIVEFMGQKIYAQDWPIVGKPNAKHVFVEMFDYTCPHCRTTSRTISAAKAQMGDDLAVVVLPVPMKRACNDTVMADHAVHIEACELSKLAVAVWRCDRAKFAEFHDWMFEGVNAPTFAAAKAKAEAMIGTEKLNKAFNKKSTAAYINKHVQMYKKVSAGVVPKLMFPASGFQGEYTQTSGLIAAIKEKTGK